MKMLKFNVFPPSNFIINCSDVLKMFNLYLESKQHFFCVPSKFKGRICHGSHLVISYRGWVIVPPDFSSLCPQAILFRVCCLSCMDFNHTHIKVIAQQTGSNNNLRRSCQILTYNNSPSMYDRQNGCQSHSITQWEKKRPGFPFQIPWSILNKPETNQIWHLISI